MRVAPWTAVLAGALALGLAAPAAAEVVWLCGPTAADADPCRGSQATTVFTPEGASRVETPSEAADPAVDCFYVYPTVSQDRSANSDKSKDPEMVAIARYQAARFSQVCRVYAPVYRQQTLLGLGAGGSSDALQLAYGDVEEAWREYLARHNRGRGVVLVGHSQGTRMLRRLVRDEIDPNPAVRRRLVSAVLLGGNVTVRAGESARGDFRHIETCRTTRQLGCVIAFSTYNETPPSNSRYGRPPAEDTSGFGFPAGPGYEIACTNPASLAGNERVVLDTLLRSEPFPGVIGLLLIQTYGGPPPTADTPWLRPRDHYTGRCEHRNGAHVLMLEPVGSARRLNPAPDPSWGLHLTDVNIALGDLVRVVGRQAAAYAAAPPPMVRPRLVLRARGCRVRVTGADRRAVRWVDFRRRGRLVARDRRAPFATRLPGGGRVTARAVLRDGRRVTLARFVRGCGAR